MLTKYLILLPLVVRASAAFLSSIDEPSEKHQKDFQMDSPILYQDPHVSGSSYTSSHLAKRDGGFFSLPLFFRDSSYYTELYMGSRGQRVEVIVNIFSPITWVMDSIVTCKGITKREVQLKRKIPEHNSKDSQSLSVKKNSGAGKAKESEKRVSSYLGLSKREARDCKALGTFNKAKSKTFKLYKADPLFAIDYGSFISNGVWGSDKVGTSKTMMEMMFGVVDTTMIDNGVLGLGMQESSDMKVPNGKQDVNFPVAVKNAGYIKKMTYSLFLHGEAPKNGSILFGAVDHAKYVGKLQTVPMVRVYKRSKLIHVSVVLNKIYLENSSQKVILLNEPIGANFHLSGSNHALPKTVFLALVESMSAEYWISDFYKVDCGYRTSTGNIVYDFSGISIKVPISHLIERTNGGTCYLGVLVHEEENEFPNAYLGDSFLRNVYLNVDLEKKEVSMAQVKVTDEENVEVISTFVPGAEKAERYSSTSLVTSVSKPTVAKFKV